MSSPNDNNSWEDIVFQDRHKDYGAYLLRRSYSNHVVLGALATLVLVAIILTAPYLAKLFNGPIVVDVAAIKSVKYTDLAPPPAIQNIQPPLRIHIPPPVKTAIKYLPPKLTTREIVEEEKMPTVDEIKNNDVAAETVEGTGEVVFEEPVAEVSEETGDDDDGMIFTVVEQSAQFPGGIEALKKFLQQNMVYPALARRMGIEGSVYVSFVVDKVGAISDVQILKGISAECDAEATRVVGMMPPWIPGKQSGHVVKSRFVLPLKFTMGKGAAM